MWSINAAEFTAKSVENASLEDWHWVYAVNVFGTAMVSKYAIPHIVNVSSVSGVLAQRDFATYGTLVTGASEREWTRTGLTREQ